MSRRIKGIAILRLAALAVTALAVLPVSGCTMAILHNLLGPSEVEETTDPAGGCIQYLCDTEIVTLAWDPPPGEITGYRVYYRVHDSGGWTLVGEVPVDDDPEIELLHADFGDGDYDFGVIAVDVESEESTMHTSLDPTAQPTTGWYLRWAL